MPARSTRFPFAAVRRSYARMATAAAASTLVAPASWQCLPPNEVEAVVRDKVQAMAADRVDPGWQRTVDTGHPTQMVGLEWQGAEPGALELRVNSPDGWSDWQLVEGDPAEGPDVDSPERHDRTTAGPVWVGHGVDQVEVRVAEGSLSGLKLHALRSEDPAAAQRRGTGAGSPRRARLHPIPHRRRRDRAGPPEQGQRHPDMVEELAAGRDMHAFAGAGHAVVPGASRRRHGGGGPRGGRRQGGPRRWCCDHPLVDDDAGATYVVSKIWGLHTEPALAVLAEAFPTRR